MNKLKRYKRKGMKPFYIITVLICITQLLLVSPVEVDDEKEHQIFSYFQNFVKAYNKTYDTTDELLERFNIFKDNFLSLEDDIKVHKPSHTSGISKFFDLTQQEYRRKHLTLDIPMTDLINAKKPTKNSLIYLLDQDVTKTQKNGPLVGATTTTAKSIQVSLISTTTSIPIERDYRQEGAVGPVKNQATCGDCWSFSTVGNIESQYFLKYGIMENLSEQQLLNCDTNQFGCNGGYMNYAFQYMNTTGGLIRGADLPYTATKNTCNLLGLSKVVKVSGYGVAGTTDENAIASLLNKYGPLSAAVNALPLNTYRGGIIDLTSTQCNPADLNHAILIVGYGIDFVTNKQYWIEKIPGDHIGEN